MKTVRAARRASAARRATPYTHAGHAARLRERARRGELATLGEARTTGDKKLYDEVLGALLKRDPSAENIRAVAAHVILAAKTCVPAGCSPARC